MTTVLYRTQGENIQKTVRPHHIDGRVYYFEISHYIFVHNIGKQPGKQGRHTIIIFERDEGILGHSSVIIMGPKKSSAKIEEEETFLECDLVGMPVFSEIDGSIEFYSEYVVKGMSVKLGDIARVTLESDDKYEDAFCQILAIYDDVQGGKGVCVEARWFKRPQELEDRKRKTLQQTLQQTGDFLEHELIETDVLDDIPAGSVIGKVEVQGYEQSKKRKHESGSSTSSNSSSSNSRSSSSSSSSSINNRKSSRDSSSSNDISGSGINNSSSRSSSNSIYYCRFLETSGSHSIQVVSMHSLFRRGMDLSDYSHAYISLIEQYESSNSSVPTDKFSTAIRKLHVSVLPEFLPCRTSERETIQNSIREAIVERNLTRALYISGMPGTGKTATVVASIRALLVEARQVLIPEFQFVEINCLRLHSPSDAYTVLWRHLSGQFGSPKIAVNKITDFFQKQSTDFLEKNNLNDADRQTIVCLVDEMDFLITTDENVVYNFFNWAMLPGSGLLLVGVSNIMDLPERLSGRYVIW